MSQQQQKTKLQQEKNQTKNNQNQKITQETSHDSKTNNYNKNTMKKGSGPARSAGAMPI